MSDMPINEQEYFDRLDFSEFDGEGDADDFLRITSPRYAEMDDEDDVLGLYERYDY